MPTRSTTIETLESRGYRVLQDENGVTVISGRGRNVRAFTFPSLEVAVKSLIQSFEVEHPQLRSLSEVDSEREEARQ